MKHLQRVKDRLTLRILTDFDDPRIATYPYKTLPAMAKAGLITQEELRTYRKARRESERKRIRRKLRESYYEKAWGEKYVRPYIEKIR